ncbi:MAG TPA: hypothetical protein ACFYEK_01325 [Candidatus Wunengus sp. YC60]|uniref:hypothetical protein n=1 Tax=Candidatus Wunengus sp. YC60 TaxID=3367697 RepID=UPI00402763E7
MSSEATHINVRKILKNKIYDETILISDIKSFRHWRKKENDLFPGEATFLVLKAKDTDDKNAEDSKQLPTMLIQESYSDFMRRMSGKVIK